MNCLNSEKTTMFRQSVTNSKHIAVFMHTNPDGDTVGGALALTEIFKNLNINVTVVSPNAIRSNLQWLPNIETVLIDARVNDIADICNKTDLIICADFSKYERAEKYSSLLKEHAEKIIVIDHHIDPSIECKLLISSTEVSSTCEIIYMLVKQTKFDININFADCIYTGILTDTGNFSYNSSHSQVFEIVIELLKSGIDKDYITTQIYKNQTADQLKLLGHVINNRLFIIPEYHSAYMYLTKDDQLKFNYQPGYSENFVNYPLTINGIRLSAFFVEEKKHIRVSLRSTGNFDVNLLSQQYFNGGGHKNAAGGKYFDSLDKVIADFKKAAEQYAGEI